MKKIIFIFCVLMYSAIFAQHKVYGAEAFGVTLPQNFERTIGLNDYATLQFESKSPKPNAYGFLIFEHKDELKLAQANLDIIDYTLNSIEPYTAREGFKYIKKPYIAYERGFNYAYTEFETNDEELGHIYFLQTVIETKDYIYQIIQYCGFNEKEIMKNDFVNIVNSFKVDE